MPEAGHGARRRRVVLVSQPTGEGVAVCVRDLATAAKAAGWHVVVACPREGQLRGWMEQAGVEWTHVDLRRPPSIFDPAAVLRLRELARDADVLHAHSSKAGALGRAAVRLLPAAQRPATIFTPHAWSWLATGHMSPAYRLVERSLATSCDAIVAVSDEEARAGGQVLGLRGSQRLRVIANGVDLERFSPTGPAAPRSDDPLIVCVGRLAFQKGQDLAVRALARMQTPRSRLRLVGRATPESRGAIVRLATELGVASRVELTGTSDDPGAHLRAADVVVVPSRWDGFSLSLLEAMACGAAVVAASVAGTENLAPDAGVTVPVESPEALAEAIDSLLAKPAWRQAIGDRARNRAVVVGDVRRTVGANLALWEEVAVRRDQRRSPRPRW